MAPIRASKSSSSLSQPPKGTQHKQRARKHACNKSSDPEDGETTNKASATHKRKHNLASSADEATDSHSTTKKMNKKKKKKRLATATDTSDEGDESGDETARDQAPEDMDENEQALSTSFFSHLLHFSHYNDRESHGQLDISRVRPLPLATLYQRRRRYY